MTLDQPQDNFLENVLKNQEKRELFLRELNELLTISYIERDNPKTLFRISHSIMYNHQKEIKWGQRRISMAHELNECLCDRITVDDLDRVKEIIQKYVCPLEEEA